MPCLLGGGRPERDRGRLIEELSRSAVGELLDAAARRIARGSHTADGNTPSSRGRPGLTS